MALAHRDSDQFARPVIILAGLGIPTAVSSAMEAYMFLADWPVAQRDATHAFAMKACLAAMRGDIEAETARGVFKSWAERRDILAPDAAAVVGSGRMGSHGIA